MNTSTKIKLDIYQPGLEYLRKILNRSNLTQQQTQDLLSHLDSRNYLFIAYSIAKHTDQSPETLVTLIKSALDLSQEELNLTSNVVNETKDLISKKKPEETKTLYDQFSQEYPEEQTSDPSNYESTGGAQNSFLDFLQNKSNNTVKEIYQSFKKSKFGNRVDQHLSSTPVIASTNEAALSYIGPIGFTTIGGVVGGVIGSGVNSKIIGSALAIKRITPVALIESKSPSFLNALNALDAGLIREVAVGKLPNILMSSKLSGYRIVHMDLGSMGIQKAASQGNMFLYELTEKGMSYAAKTGTTLSKLLPAGKEITANTAKAILSTASTATKGAITTSTTAVSTTASVGTAAAGPIGTLIGAITGLILSLLPNILKWLKENIEPILGGSAVFLGSLWAGVGVGPSFIFGGISSAAINFFKNLPNNNTLSYLTDSFFGQTLIASFSPLIIGVIVGPLLIIFFILIINNSAFVVPPANPLFSTVNTVNVTPTLGPTPPGGGFGAGYNPGAFACIPGNISVAICPDISTCTSPLNYCSPIGEPCDTNYCAGPALNCPELNFCCKHLITATLTPTPPTP